MKAIEWVDRVKSAKGIESDYAAAKALGISRNAVSRYRNVPCTLDEDVAAKVAEALGVKLSGVLIDQMAERAKSEKARRELKKEAERIMQIVSTRGRPKRSEVVQAMSRHMQAWPAPMH